MATERNAANSHVQDVIRARRNLHVRRARPQRTKLQSAQQYPAVSSRPAIEPSLPGGWGAGCNHPQGNSPPAHGPLAQAGHCHARRAACSPCVRRAQSECREPIHAAQEIGDPSQRCYLIITVKPRSPWQIRPRSSTAVASTITRPAPPIAKRPRCTRCQSSAIPSVAQYWHIGEIAMRLGNSTSRNRSGVKRRGRGSGYHETRPFIPKDRE